MARKRTVHSPQFKAKVALRRPASTTTISELARKYSLHPKPDSRLEEAAGRTPAGAFSTPRFEDRQGGRNALIPELYQQIGRLQVELEWLKKTPISRD